MTLVHIQFSGFSRLVCLLIAMFLVSVSLVQTITRTSDVNLGCLVSQSSDYTLTYVLDLNTGNLLTYSMLKSNMLGPDIQYIGLRFKDETSAVFTAVRQNGEELLIGENRYTGKRSIVSLSSQTGSMVIVSNDGRYVAVFDAGSLAQKQISIYSLPELRLIVSRPWVVPSTFRSPEWSPEDHHLAYLEGDSNNGVQLTIVEPDTLQPSSPSIVANLPDYNVNGLAFLSWSPDSEYISIQNGARLDVYRVKDQIIHNVVDSADIRWEEDEGPRVFWAGDHHRLLYLPRQQSYDDLWAYDPDIGRSTELMINILNSYSQYPDNTHAILKHLGQNAEQVTTLLNLVTQDEQEIKVDGENADFVSWLEKRDEVVFSAGNKLLLMHLDGSNQHKILLTNAPVMNPNLFFAQAESWLAYSNLMPDHSTQIGIINLDTGFQRSLGDITDGFGNIYLSPDASVVALDVDSSDNRGVTLTLAASDGNWFHTFHTDTGNYADPIWSPDSTKIALMTYIYGQRNTVHILSADGEPLKQFDLPPKDLFFKIWNDCEIP